MTPYKNKNLIEGLRETLANVERTPGVSSDDPALTELRSILKRRVAALERDLAIEFSAGAIDSDRDYKHKRPEPKSFMGD